MDADHQVGLLQAQKGQLDCKEADIQRMCRPSKEAVPPTDSSLGSLLIHTVKLKCDHNLHFYFHSPPLSFIPFLSPSSFLSCQVWVRLLPATLRQAVEGLEHWLQISVNVV